MEENINTNIKKYIKEHGINITALARNTGFSKQNLIRILNSDDIKVSQVYKISEALDKDKKYFFNIKSEEEKKEIEALYSQVKENNERLKKLIVSAVYQSYYNESLHIYESNKKIRDSLKFEDFFESQFKSNEQRIREIIGEILLYDMSALFLKKGVSPKQLGLFDLFHKVQNYISDNVNYLSEGLNLGVSIDTKSKKNGSNKK
ncbi:MAG: helix-turn-helix transcriptional regulator [Bacteroidia bacterium]|nr:helix-turn-helix transcriptional regulator [Bacteroidia bacterium]